MYYLQVIAIYLSPRLEPCYQPGCQKAYALTCLTFGS